MKIWLVLILFSIIFITNSSKSGNCSSKMNDIEAKFCNFKESGLNFNLNNNNNNVVKIYFKVISVICFYN